MNYSGGLSVEAAKSSVILVLDQNMETVRLLKSAFNEKGWEMHHTADPEFAVKYYFENKPDCFLLNTTFIRQDEFVELNEALWHARESLVPVVMLENGDSSQSHAELYHAGANDVIRVPFHVEEVMARIQRQLEIQIRIQDIALLDGTVGVYNQTYTSIEMERQISDLRRTREPFTLIALELDRVTEINELYGYMEGMKAIQSMAQYVKGRIRNTDVLIHERRGRFILILPRTFADNAISLVRRLQKEFAAQIVETKIGTYTRTFSAGLLEVVDGEWNTDLCRQMAGQALSDVKQAGGNESVIFRFDDQESSDWKRVLQVAIIDDDDMIRSLLETRLKEMGGPQLQLDIRSYRDGEYFFEDSWHKQKGQFLLILDRNMPRMNGMEVLRKLRMNYDRSRYQVMMLTVVNNETSISQAIEAGADDYMTKPFSLLELESRILRLIKGKKR